MDDAWLNNFASSQADDYAQSQSVPPSSLLQQPADTAEQERQLAERQRNETRDRIIPGPPNPTVARRAASYHALRRHTTKPKQRRRRSDVTAIEDGVRKHDYHLRSALRSDDWTHDMETELLEAGHEKYQLYYDELQIAQGRLDSLLESTRAALGLLSSLSESFQVVEAQTSDFQAQCQTLLSSQKRVTKLAEDVKENLRYYEYLEPITRRLNAPGSGSLVRGKDFSEKLANLDACLDYMSAHPEQREAATYQAKYRLLMTRALTLIRVHFTESLRALAADVSQRSADDKTQNSTLLYARFRAIAPELKELGLEIQKRAILPADAEHDAEPEYQSLMNELYQSYSATRGRLILPMVARRMAEIAAAEESKQDVIVLARDAISYIRGICLDEYSLWGAWFIGDAAVYEFLESICEPLYDYLRPRTIHETKLTKLCELCAFIQSRYARSDEDDDEDDDDELLDRPDGNDGRELDFTAIVQPALADAQTRLVFLAQAALRDDVERFKPSPQDLDSCKRSSVNGKTVALSGRRTSQAPVQSPRTPGTPALGEGGNVFETQLKAHLDTQTWYPTLPKAVRLLSRIYRLVNSSVFDDLAHRIVYSTTQSLVSAAAQIKIRSGPIDGNLFLISQLLGLKQQIVAFDIEYVTSEVGFDFSSLTDTFYELRERGGLWNPATWYKLASGGLLPRVVENMLDAKADLDGRLRTAINELVNSYASSISAPLSELRDMELDKARNKDDAAGGKETKSHETDARRATTAVRGLTEKEVPFLRAKLDEYMADARTKETLVAAVRDQVVAAYEEWVTSYEQGAGSGPGKLGRVSRKGKGREEDVWGGDVFADWCERAFAAGRVE